MATLTTPHNNVRVVRIVVASPSDVQQERDAVEAVANELNRDVAADRNLVLRVIRWETDTYPGFHPKGPQALIDTLLKIESCDLLVGIFWKRMGTPTLNSRSGTEHEIKKAYRSWQKRGAPALMIYFNQKTHKPKTKEDQKQWDRVKDFQTNFPATGLWWSYVGKNAFTRLIRSHLTRWILRAPENAVAPKKFVRKGPGSRTKKSSAVKDGATTSVTVSKIKLNTLKKQLSSLAEDHAAAGKQLNNTLAELDRSRLKRQMENLESEMTEIEQRIAAMKTR